MSVQGSSSLKYSDLFKPPEPTSSTDSSKEPPKESEWKVVSHSRGRRRARSTPPHTSQNTPSPKDSSLVARTDKAATDIFNSAKHKAIETTKRSDQQSRSLPILHLLAENPEPIVFHSAHQTNHNDPQRMLCDAILQANRIITMRIFNIGSPEIIRALIRAVRRNIPVVVSAWNFPNLSNWDRESELCVELRGNPQICLHKKTTLIDNQLTIIGTANYTKSSFFKDINLTALIQNPALYSLILSDTRGSVSIGSQTISYYPLPFPQSNTKILPIIQEIQKAQRTIKIAMNIFSHTEIFLALEQARLRGVTITIVINKKESAHTLDILHRISALLLLKSVTTVDSLHAKICLIDNQTLIFGSPNWTYHGMHKNLEDLLIVTPLTPKQIHSIQEIWAFLLKNSSPV
ncbi:phospholipase D-like domain-containing protein [Chlamydia trachomatis]|uniref:phospholipase D-like domain-containing protein n=1 Tax=Chlamydia trachomatis TaxID=813 RepID=UPI0002530DBD|nr:phospholipase D-like domain-containing protein [Chlamydia trachomatis]CCE12432.1 phosphatidylcholine-hydrolyzing phospholipase D (PLD) protein [Chlamydia trachomatis E/SW3]